jgi:hypothetical protein
VIGFLVTVWSSGMLDGQWFRIFYVLAGSGMITAAFAMCGGQIDQAIRSRGQRIERLGALERRAEILIARTDADDAASQAGALILRVFAVVGPAPHAGITPRVGAAA